MRFFRTIIPLHSLPRIPPEHGEAVHGGGDCTKLSPTVTIKAGETVTLADIRGAGLIQNMWFTGYVGHRFILRIYWEDQAHPSY